MPDRLLLPGTLWRLGLGNVARVAGYKLSLKTGRNAALKPAAPIGPGPFFRGDGGDGSAVIDLLGWHRHAFDSPPDWHQSPFPGGKAIAPDLRWDQALGALPPGSDVKEFWELSRWAWMAPMAQAGHVGTLNAWLADWVAHNPPFRGINWGCGQETGLRVLHLALAARLLGQDAEPEPALCALVKAHLDRIEPTMSYAIAQDNNHGSSEAAALFVGGSWLGDTARAGKGRRWLEDRAGVLFQADGSSNQYSVTYHRTVLETYCFAEIWRRARGLPEFSARLTERMAKAAHWLRQATDPDSGDAPNIGSNDGGHVLQTAGCPYRDFRPTVQLSTALFAGQAAYAADGPWDRPLQAHGLDKPATPAEPVTSQSFDDGGYHVLRKGAAVAWMRYPRFRYRPAQADALHVDLWRDGQPLLVDAGSYSYAKAEGAAFNRTSAHNTVEFDGRDQMPKLGAFLYGAWLAAEDVAPVEASRGTVRAGAAYTDRHGARHDRRIELSEDRLKVVDTLDGTWKVATLRWRLAPGDWRLEGQRLTDGRTTLTLAGAAGISDMRLVRGEKAEFYLQKSEVPVLEVAIDRPGKIMTEVVF